MAARPVLIVLIVRDAGLRATLAARLSTDGLELLSADHWRDAWIGRGLVRSPAVLVIDSAAAAELADGWIEEKLAENLFERVILLDEGAPAPSGDASRFMRINADIAMGVISQLFAGNYDPDQSAPLQEV